MDERSQSLGRKAEALGWLIRHGFAVPPTLVCRWEAHARHLAGDAQVVDDLRHELQAALIPDRSYAVRSSANAEDSPQHSFAGQFKTLLAVRGVEAVLEAIQEVWASADAPAVRAYLQGIGMAQSELKMAVVVQEMVTPLISGVSFSKNPMTGMDEVIVEAVRGSGEALVQAGATPARWVNKWGAWISKPESDEISLDLIADVVRDTKAIARAYGRPVDLEWVYDGQRLCWVQLREITALNVPLYSNRISREVFPGIIKPLVWSVNVPLVNGAWVRLFTELILPNDIDPLSLAKTFYYRAYFSMGALGQIFELLGLPRESLELLVGIDLVGPDKPSFKPTGRTYTLLPRMVRTALSKLGVGRQVVRFLPAMKQRFQHIRQRLSTTLGEQDLLDEIDRLYPLAQETAYYNIVVPLLMHIYSRVLRGRLGRIGVDPDSLDLVGGMAEMEQLDPSRHLSRLHRQTLDLDAALQACIRTCTYAEFRRLPGIEPLQADVKRFLEQFGHLSDSGNDFSHVPWRENPDLILGLIADYRPPEAAGKGTLQFDELPIPAVRRAMLRPLYARARQFRLYRQGVSSLYTFGYGLFRDLFLALANRFVQRGALVSRDDVFYFTFDEVRGLVSGGLEPGEARRLVAQRRCEIEQVRELTPPSTIYGDEAPPLDVQATRDREGTRNVRTGIPTSRGHYTGPARVVERLQDMNKLEEGDVLVIPYSDVGWTPLFAKAGAVVAESGGMLSHSSIVAREYGIPAVVSVAGACQLRDGVLVSVDGFRGEVVVHESA